MSPLVVRHDDCETLAALPRGVAPARSDRSTGSLSPSLLALWGTSADAQRLPAYRLAVGVTVTEASVHTVDRRLTLDPSSDWFQHSGTTWLRLVHRLSPESSSAPDADFEVWIPTYTTFDVRDRSVRPTPSSHELERSHLLVTRGVDGWEVSKGPADADVTTEPASVAVELAMSIANEETYLTQLPRVGAHRDFEIGAEYPLSEMEQTIFGGTGTIRLDRVGEAWGRRVATFVVTFETPAGIPSEDCGFTFDLLEADGRPLQMSKSCRMSAPQEHEGRSGLYHAVVRQDRGFAYSDLPVSELVPRPLPALQPRGKIEAVAFSEPSGILAFVTKPVSADSGTTEWLSFWDIHQRRIIRSRLASGTLLLASNSGQALVNIGEDYFIQTFIVVDGDFQEFAFKNYSPGLDTKLLSADLVGLYVVTLNNRGELEIFNPGYGRRLHRSMLPGGPYELLATTEDGRVVAASGTGSLYVGMVDIDVEGCGTTNGGCEVAMASLDGAVRPDRLELGLIPSAPLSKLELDPDRPWLLYCSESARRCGVVNYETGKSVEWSGQTAALAGDGVATPTSWMPLPPGLDGTLPEGSKRSADGAHLAVSRAQGLRFVVTHGSSFASTDILAVADLQTGIPLASLSSSVPPIRSLQEFSDGILLVVLEEPSGWRSVRQLKLADLSVEEFPEVSELDLDLDLDPSGRYAVLSNWFA